MYRRRFNRVGMVLFLLNVSLIALTAWQISVRQSENIRTNDELIPVGQQNYETRVVSAKDGFSVVFPSGWEGIKRVLESDRFVIAGKLQPSSDVDAPPEIEDIISYRDDLPAILDIQIGQSLPSPQGDATDVLIGSGKQLLSGRKYRYVYSGNDLSTERKNGDIDLAYNFSLSNDRELRVTYRIYSDDQTDNSAVIDKMVRSIQRR